MPEINKFDIYSSVRPFYPYFSLEDVNLVLRTLSFGESPKRDNIEAIGFLLLDN